MSYERDKDKFTRGVGAIAALDAGNRARLAHRLRRTRRTNLLDRQLAEYTFRPGGGVGALGMINMGTLGVGQRLAGGTGSLRGPTTTGSPGVIGPGGGAPRQPTRLYGGAGSMLQQPALYTPSGAVSRWGGATLTNIAGQLVSVGPTMIVDPVHPGVIMPGTVPVTGTIGGGSGVSTVSSGGGGGGGGYSTPPAPSYPGAEAPEVPDVPEDGGAPKPGMDLKKVAMIGGAAVAIWYLFFRKKSGGAP